MILFHQHLLSECGHLIKLYKKTFPFFAAVMSPYNQLLSFLHVLLQLEIPLGKHLSVFTSVVAQDTL
jgi:hypothetical protein